MPAQLRHARLPFQAPDRVCCLPALLAPVVRTSAEDAWKRLVLPSLTNDIRRELTATAVEQALKSCASNARQLLLQPKLGGVVLAVDPGTCHPRRCIRAACLLHACECRCRAPTRVQVGCGRPRWDGATARRRASMGARP